ncbi:MAG: hypothetical protein PXX73_03965 [Sideroxydans sp.]|nr:hypothetical protein [Sideroxydans sp.]
MKNLVQKLLLMLFVLLQCIAPLAHAHVDGLDAEANLYSHDTQHSLPHSAHLENQLGAVVTVAQATPMNFVLDVDEPELLSRYAPLPQVFISPRALSSVNFSFPHSPRYFLAWSQAPPL